MGPRGYLAEGYKQPSDNSNYVEVNNYKGKLLVDLTEKSNKIFKTLCNKKVITEKEMKYFTYSFKNASCLGKMYLLPKIHKRLYNIPGRPVISNCGTPTEKMLEFLDHHLQPVMNGGKSYVKETNHFLEKLKELGKVPHNAISVTLDVVGLYPSIPHDAGYSLRSHLIRKKVYPLITEKGSSYCVKTRCETCFNIQETDTFQSFVTKEVYKINHHFHCDSKCVIYLISCKVCGLQYVGSTKLIPPIQRVFLDAKT